MKYDLSIIISHYCSDENKNPLSKTLESISQQSSNPNIEWEIDYNDFIFKYKTNQKLSKGQELFINYGNPERKDLK